MINKQNQLVDIIESAGNVIPFLKELTKAEKEALLPTLAELNKKYSKTLEDRNDKSGYGPWNNFVYPVIHREIIQIVGVVLAKNVTQYRENIDWGVERILMSNAIVDNILPWYVPNWFQSTMNRTRNLWSLDYEKLMLLKNRGYLQPSDELITMVFERSACRLTKGEGRNTTQVYSHDLLVQHKEALEEHFWFLFKYVSAINNRQLSDKYSWYNVIPELLAKNQIDRDRLIKSCLLACTKGFNKTQTAWYYKLLKKIEPRLEELINCQNELMTCLNSGQSSAINYALLIVKKIIEEKDFERMNFIYACHSLLNLPAKSTVKSVLILLEKIMRKTPRLKNEIVDCFINVLSHNDNDIQTKSAKFLKKHIEPTDENIQKISIFRDGLLSDSRLMLNDFLIQESHEDQEEAEEVLTNTNLNPLSEKNKIESYDSFDDMVFFLTQFNENEEYWHTEQILRILPKINKLITVNNADKLSQFFCKALNEVASSTWGTSAITNIYAYLINEFAQKIDQRFPSMLVGREKNVKRLISVHESYGPPYPSLKDRRGNHHLPITRFISKQVEYCQELINRNLNLEILSIPTHHGGWIHPERHISRILKLQDHNVEINLIDWQLSIMRLYKDFEITQDYNSKLIALNNPTIINVLQYLFGLGNLEYLNESSIGYYLPAILSIGNAEDLNKLATYKNEVWSSRIYNFVWNHGPIEFLTWEYNRQTQKSDRVVRTKDVLYIEGCKYQRPEQNTSETKSLFGSFTNALFGKSEKEDLLEITNLPRKSRVDMFDYFDFKSEHKSHHYIRNTVHLQANDTKRHLNLIPNNKELYINLVIHYHMEKSETKGAESKRVIVNALEYLIENWYLEEEHEIIYVLLAASILNQNKIARQLVAELWIQAVENQNFDSKRLGIIIGFLLSKNYGPLKRLTEIIGNFMILVSPKHDKELYRLIENVVINMHDIPITNTKKLLEILFELQSKSPIQFGDDFKVKLDVWSGTRSLQRIINKINA